MPKEEMVNVFVPPLVAQLTRAEELANRPLKKEEVLCIRDKATVVTQPLSAMPKLSKERGYLDLYAPEASLKCVNRYWGRSTLFRVELRHSSNASS